MCLNKNMCKWYVYIVKCSDKSLYTGITKNIERRINEHNNSNSLGSRYTRGRRPVKLVYQEAKQTRSEATRRECEIKKLSRREKEVLLTGSSTVLEV